MSGWGSAVLQHIGRATVTRLSHAWIEGDTSQQRDSQGHIIRSGATEERVDIAAGGAHVRRHIFDQANDRRVSKIARHGNRLCDY